MLAHMKTHHIDNDNGVIMLTVPKQEINKIAKAIENLLVFGGHTINHLNDEDAGTLSFEQVFPDANPGMILRGFRGRDELTQEELAERLGINQAMISDMENGKRSVSVKMAKALGEVFEVSYKAFL